jgi:hypothetical protein
MIPIGQDLKVSLSYNLGHNYYTNTYWVRGNYSQVPYDVKTSIKSSDYILSIQYDLINHEKKKTTQNSDGTAMKSDKLPLPPIRNTTEKNK